MDTRALTTLIPRLFIRTYQILTGGLARRCRFVPSCSDYMLEALEAKGLWLGLGLGIKRIFKCHPWHPGGYDPVDVIPAQAGIHQS